jgi:CheY-like chemotaxis protein
MKILIADDNAKTRNYIKKILGNSDHEFIEVNNGKDAVSAFIDHKPEVVLMDIKMEEMDGIEASRMIRQHFQDTKLIIITDYYDKQFREEAKAVGAANYLIKDNLLDLRKLI